MEPIPLTPHEIRQACFEAYSKVEDPRELIGRHVPSPARIWAEEHRLVVRETTFAPPGRLYIVGAVPVEGVLIP
jgi:hypothetical protein